jgi:hypothetical protein
MSKIAADLSSRPFSIARANVPRRAASVVRGPGQPWRQAADDRQRRQIRSPAHSL